MQAGSCSCTASIRGERDELLPGLIASGGGGGLVNPTMTVAALSVVAPERSGMASGVNNTCRQLGIAAGIAGLGAVLQARDERDLAHGARPGGLLASCLDAVLLVSTAVALVGVLVVLALVHSARHGAAATPPAPARAP